MMVQTTASSTEQGGRKPWLVLFNCQATGLANCLNLLCPDIAVEYHALSPKMANINALIASKPFDRILTFPHNDQAFGIDLSGRENVWQIPTILFHGYHPDFCHLFSRGKLLKGPLEGLHSIIAHVAFRCGLTEKQALKLYCEDTYKRLGYLDGWDDERDRFVNVYKKHGFDVSQCFIEWTRSGAFMHTLSHPKINVLRDLAKMIINRSGYRLNTTSILPHDNLANGPVYPIYPEIGSRLGVRGDYLFKFGGRYECIDLEEFVHLSYEIYRGSPEITFHPLYEDRLSSAVSIIEAIR
jgi:hypothetical protein